MHFILIQKQIDMFCQGWAHHSMRTEGEQDSSAIMDNRAEYCIVSIEGPMSLDDDMESTVTVEEPSKILSDTQKDEFRALLYQLTLFLEKECWLSTQFQRRLFISLLYNTLFFYYCDV